MKKHLKLGIFVCLLFIFSCSEDDSLGSSTGEASTTDEIGEGGTNPDAQAGLITAGEWNDLEHWDFWNELLSFSDYSQMPAYWKFNTENRISVIVEGNSGPKINSTVKLFNSDALIWEAKTDNHGRAELWINLFDNTPVLDISTYDITVDNELIAHDLIHYDEGINFINLNDTSTEELRRVELSFVVDATGSMSDELDFLKADLQDIIQTVENEDSKIDVWTSSVFYRDEGDDYVVKHSPFTAELSQTIEYIGQQNANGGGDYPEAVHSALDVAINDLQWSSKARTRIVFLLLDAPPHYAPEIISHIQNNLRLSAGKGIKIIPIVASGIDKNTEFLMRYMAISTNGTYVFITDDSGIGNDHLEPSVGPYEVELLNALLLRLIKKYSE
jgi:hypothetical protein